MTAMSSVPSLLPSVMVEEIERRSAFRALAPAWRSLAARSGAPGPFLDPLWFAVYAADLAREPGSLRLLVAHRRGALAGALPLLVERRRIGGVPARVLRSLSDDHSQRFEVLADGDDALRALFRHLAADPGWDVLELRDLVDAPESPGARLAAIAAEEGFPTGAWPAMTSPYLPLPATAKELEAALGAKFRANLNRRARRLADELGPVALERVEARGLALAAAVDEGLALEASGWKGEQGTAIAQDERLRRRYLALAHAFAGRGELSLHFLRAGERRVAFHFAVESGGVYYLFKPGYDESLARFGLGHLLLHEVAKALVGRGVREIDFLGDDMPWKRSWTGLARRHLWRYVLRPTVAGRALCAWKFRAVPMLRRSIDELRRFPPVARLLGEAKEAAGEANEGTP